MRNCFMLSVRVYTKLSQGQNRDVQSLQADLLLNQTLGQSMVVPALVPTICMVVPCIWQYACGEISLRWCQG